MRPTTDFAKEALFNILTHRIDFNSTELLDLFAGTGNISYEFASRGCQDIVCVDANFGCVKYIQKIAEELDFKIQTVKSDVFKYVKAATGSFDVIFADPPYDFDVHQLEILVKIIMEKGILTSEGMIIIEHTKHNDLSKIAHFSEARRYGGTVFSFFIVSEST